MRSSLRGACLLLLAVAESRRLGALDTQDFLPGKPERPSVPQLNRLTEKVISRSSRCMINNEELSKILDTAQCEFHDAACAQIAEIGVDGDRT